MEFFWVFLVACVGGVVAAALRSHVRRLEQQVASLAAMTERHAAAGTVLYERIEALRQRVEADEAKLSELALRPAASRAPGVVEARFDEGKPVVAAPRPERPAVTPAETSLSVVDPASATGADVAALRVAPAADAEQGAPRIESAKVAGPESSGPPATLADAEPPAAPTPEEPADPPLDDASPAAIPPAAAAPPPVESSPRPSGPPPPLPPPPPPPRPFDWESLVGVRLFSGIAGVAFVLAAVFFLRYSIDQGLLSPPVRLAIGILTGLALLVVSETRGRSRWNVTANALGAAGIAILFASFFAADSLWHLLPQAATFALMVLVTAVAVLLAVRHDSVYIALLGLVGGFATPILLSSGEDRPIGLFGYLLVLNVGLAWLGRRRGWTVVIALSVAFTAIYQWGWVTKFLLHKPEELPIAVGAFLAFPALVSLSRVIPPRDDAAEASRFEATATVSAALPLLFALCFAWVPALGDHYVLLFAYLFVLDLGLAVIAAATRNVLLHGASALATALVFAGWLPTAYEAYAWPTILGVVALFVLFFLAAPFGARWLQRRRTRDTRPHVEFAPVHLAGPLLLFPVPVLIYMEPAAASPVLVFSVLFALLAAIAAVALLESAGALYFIGAFFAVVAEAVWSARYLGPPRLHAALLLYGAFGVFHIVVPLLARRWKRRLEPGWSAAALLIASLALLLFLAAGPVAHLALWGMAILLAILNLGLFFDDRPERVSWLAGLGMMLSWVVIAIWWATAMEAPLLPPALGIVGGFAVLLVGGNLWVDSRTATAGEGADRRGVYLGLVGHLFLLFVASQRALAAPPWPLFGVMFVLDLAILVAALYARRAELHLATVAASQLVLAVWVITARSLPSASLPWPEVGLLAALGVAGLGLLAPPLAQRRGAEHVLFSAAAAVGLLGLQAVVAVAGASRVAPSYGWLVAVPCGALLALAGLAAARRWHWLMLVALAPYAIGTTAWIAAMSRQGFLPIIAVAGVPYAIWLAYPVWLGARSKESPARHPYFAAVLASAAFFFFGRRALLAGGFEPFIGALPVGQATLLLGLTFQLLRAEPSAQRDRGRLAVVAGAALAFVTTAIPLQLDKQWITIGWALEGAALAWLYVRVVHKGLLATAAGLSLAVVLRLSLNPAVLSYHARGAHPIWNWYLYAYAVAATSLLVGGAILAGTDDRFARFPGLPRVSSTMRGGATLLLFLLVNIEIADYWSTGRDITFNFSSGIAQDLTYTLGWAIFAINLLAVGILRESRAARLTALLLLVVTVAKAFLHDLWRLGGLYRVGSFVGLAFSLALVAVILQRFVLPPTTKATKRSPS